MKKLILHITVYSTIFLSISACSDDLSDLNENTKDPSEANGEALFASGEKNLADILVSPDKGENNLRLWVQYWQETTYPNESRYLNISRGVSDTYWETLYTDVLKNLDEAEHVIKETDDELSNAEKPNKEAIIEILKVYAFSNLVETYGDIIYKEALDDDNTLPEYTDGKTVYVDLIDRLDEALDHFTTNGSFDETSDLIYEGNTERWKLFANTLKLRMGLLLAENDPELAKKTVEEAYNDGVIASNEDDATYQYADDVPNNNPLNNTLVVSGRKDFVVGSTVVDKMNDIQDPRRAFYFDSNLQDSLGKVEDAKDQNIVLKTLNDDAEIGNGVYINNDDENPTYLGYIKKIDGKTIQLDYADELPEIGDDLIFSTYKGGEIGVKSSYGQNSHVHQSIRQADYPGTLLSYAETEFLLAEADERGFDVGQSAKDHYTTAIKASFDKWGAPHVEEYLSKENVDYNQAKSTSSSDPAWKEVIGTQAWLALYNRTFATWLSVRRLNYPVLTPPERKDSDFPLRYTYPTSEQNLNAPNQEEAADHIGGDEVSTPLFWNQNNPQSAWDW